MSRARGNIVQTPSQFRAEGIESILRQISPSQGVYVSIDIDVLDLPLVPGCASAEPGGLSFDELRQSLFAIAGHAQVVGFDLVEINPMLDVPSGATSLLGAQLVLEMLGKVVEHSSYAARRASAQDQSA
jgi:agmatinase